MHPVAEEKRRIPKNPPGSSQANSLRVHVHSARLAGLASPAAHSVAFRGMFTVHDPDTPCVP